MELINANGLKKIFYQGSDAEVAALKGVDVSVQSGEMIAIVGRSGSGKSTLMHILGCVDKPTEGNYEFYGKSVDSLSETQLANIRNTKIGFVLQEFGLILNKTALENVSIPLYFNPKVKYKDIRKKSLAALQQVGLEHKANSIVSELSGGQKQRVAIARAIVNEPALILADEPTGALDRSTADEIMNLFHKLNEKGMTVVIVTHDMNIADMCERVIEITDGIVVGVH